MRWLTPWRLVVVAASLALAWAAMVSALVRVSLFDNAAQALRWAPHDPRALVLAADARLADAVRDGVAAPEVATMARESLQQQALNPTALRLLGFAADAAGGDNGPVRVVEELALRTSRHEFGAHAWLIEDAVRRQDVDAAIKHYDIALRVSQSSWPVLLPKLIEAVGSEAVRKSLAPVIAQQPGWLYGFLEEAERKPGNGAALAQLMMAAGRWPQTPPFKLLQRGLLDSLVAEHQFGLLRRYARQFPGAGAELFTSPALSDANLDQANGVQAWQSLVTAASGMRPGDNGGMVLFADAGARRTVAQKLLLLRPGSYRLTVTYGAEVTLAGGTVTWSVECLSAAERRAIWQSTPLSPSARSTFAATLAFSAGCEAYVLSASLSEGTGQQSLAVEVRAIGLVPG